MPISRNPNLPPDSRSIGSFTGRAVTLTRFDLWQAQANLHYGLDHMKLLESLVISAYCPEQRPQKHEPQQAQTSLIQRGFPVLTFALLPTDVRVNG